MPSRVTVFNSTLTSDSAEFDSTDRPINLKFEAEIYKKEWQPDFTAHFDELSTDMSLGSDAIFPTTYTHRRLPRHPFKRLKIMAPKSLLMSLMTLLP